MAGSENRSGRRLAAQIAPQEATHGQQPQEEEALRSRASPTFSVVNLWVTSCLQQKGSLRTLRGFGYCPGTWPRGRVGAEQVPVMHEKWKTWRCCCVSSLLVKAGAGLPKTRTFVWQDGAGGGEREMVDG